MDKIQGLHQTLQREYGHQDWSSNLRAGPECLCIIGENLLVTSRPSTIGMKLSGPGLENTTLYANVSDVAHMGMETFRSTGQSMELVSSLAWELAKKDGTIETILKFCNPGQGAAEDRHLHRHLRSGREAVQKCIGEIDEIIGNFKAWERKTSDLFKALEEATAHNVAESKDIRRTMDDTSCEAKIIEDECADIREQLRKQEEHIEELRRKQAEYERIASSLRNGIFWTNSNSWFRGSWLFGSESPVLGSLAAPLIMVAGSLVLSSDYWTSRSTLSEMELLQAERESKARELASKTERLERVLQELSSERNSIHEVLQVVKSSLRHMTALQGQVQSFMDYILRISRVVERTASVGQIVYDTAEDVKSLRNAEIKNDLLRCAFDMRTRCNFAARASAVYTTVSSQYILPTLNVLPGLRLTEDGSEEDVNKRLSRLRELRQDICQGAERLAASMHEDLKNDIREIVEMSELPQKQDEISESWFDGGQETPATEEN